MKDNAPLTIASVLSVLLLTIHLTDDIRRGVSGGGLENIPALVITSALLVGVTVLAGTRTGFICALLVGIASLGMPVIHMMRAGVGVGSRVADYPHAFRFIETLLALGVLGSYVIILSARGLAGLKDSRRTP